MATIVVDIASMGVSRHPDDTVVTYSLGSCLGVAMYDPVAKVGGMIHCMLPLSSVDPLKAKERPCMFVDTGLPILMQKLFDMGLRKSRALVRMAGAAAVISSGDLFRIGERNVAVFRRIMWKNGMLISSEEVGGHISRTLRLEVGTGRTFIKSGRAIHEMQDRIRPHPGMQPGGGPSAPAV